MTATTKKTTTLHPWAHCATIGVIILLPPASRTMEISSLQGRRGKSHASRCRPPDVRCPSKLRYFNEGNSRQYIDYDHLKKMIGGQRLIGHKAGVDDDDTNDNKGLVKYIIHDGDAQHRLATQFRLQDIHIISCNIPLEWYKEFVHVYLIAAEKYDVYWQPHVVLMKAIAHMAYAKYGPESHTRTHSNTKDFSRQYIRMKLSRYHG
ncbi:hypothetical protein JTB14_020899 [Gonioctena quinquepunctata]|nr:hypothetical protein JTB14_020899 [Gonioctena quinquepunctata]